MIFVRARPAAVDARKELAVGKRHARRQRHQRNEVAPVQRQRRDLLLVDVQAHFAAGRLQQRRRGGDLDGLGGLADLQLHVERRPIRQPQNDARLPVGPEARLLDREYVMAGGQPEEVILAPLVGKRRSTAPSWPGPRLRLWPSAPRAPRDPEWCRKIRRVPPARNTPSKRRSIPEAELRYESAWP